MKETFIMIYMPQNHTSMFIYTKNKLIDKYDKHNYK